MRAKTPKFEPRKCSETSAISIGLRRSGLSLPYLPIASRNGMRGNGAAVTGLPSANSSNTPCMTDSMTANTSSWVAKAISMSSW